ncbi:MAG: hypothetical protein J5864_08880 [Oscillospiraceae bacterium]|nr:hypothetical protein [Oscillospiraceae bacterium]
MYSELLRAVAVPVIRESSKKTLERIAAGTAVVGGFALICTMNSAISSAVKNAVNDAHARRQEKRKKAEEKKADAEREQEKATERPETIMAGEEKLCPEN